MEFFRGTFQIDENGNFFIPDSLLAKAGLIKGDVIRLCWDEEKQMLCIKPAFTKEDKIKALLNIQSKYEKGSSTWVILQQIRQDYKEAKV